ncbi:MAG: glycosyltransferase family 39 protein [Planctomycetota bacterium]|nr:glycosyltransferase family 39 protein [Planctomycetota bacterium]MDG2144721.1 glycosyltransferase family 39 protein [Planctomycetota bacterium]
MSRYQATLALALLMVLGLVLRLVGSSSLLPHHPEPDTYVTRQSDWSDDEASIGKYPLLLVSIDAAIPFGNAKEVGQTAPLSEHLASAAAPFVKTRRWFSVLSMLLVLSTYWIGRNFFRRPAAVFAAATIAVHPLLIVYANQARPHVPTAALASLGVVFCLRALRTRRPADLLLAGLVTGLAAAAFLSGVFALGSLAVVVTVALWQRWSKCLPTIAAVLAIIAGLMLWSYQPKQAEEPRDPVALAAEVKSAEALAEQKASRKDGTSRLDATGGTQLLGGSQHRVYFHLFNGGGFLILGQALYSHAPLLMVLSILGSLLCLTKLLAVIRRARNGGDPHGLKLLTTAGYAGSFLLLFGVYAGSNERFFVALLPYLALVAAVPLVELAKSKARLATCLAVGLLVLPLAVSSRIVWLRIQPDSFQVAATWLQERADGQLKGSRTSVFVGSFGFLPMFQANPHRLNRSVRKTSIWGRYLLNHKFQQSPYAMLYMESSKQKFATIAEGKQAAAKVVGNADLAIIYASKGHTMIGLVGQLVRQRGELLYATPNKNPDARSMKYALGPQAFLDVWKIQHLGAPLEVYRLEPGAQGI